MRTKIEQKYNHFCETHESQLPLIVIAPFFLCTVWLIFFLLFPKMYHAWAIIFELLFCAATDTAYLLFGTVTEDKVKVRLKRLMKISIFECVFFMTSLPLFTLGKKMRNSGIITVSIMMVPVIVILLIMLLRNEKVAGFIDGLDTGIAGGFGSKKVLAPGDIVLCDIKDEVSAKAKDPREILPAKDRFLHMLILGPTGCGKTSQILLPMINQDMQNPEWGITVLEPKGDLAIKAAMMAKHYGREVVYFDPSYKNCPKFNPLAGREIDVVENMATTFKMLNPDSPQFFLDLNEQLIRNAVKVLKRLDKQCGIEGKNATLINLGRLLQNSGGAGRDMVNQFSRVASTTETEAKENADIASWFLNDYFPERSKVYENTSGVRSQVSKLVSNEYLREVLNPEVDKGEHNTVNFDEHLAKGGVICISTAQGVLRELSKYLGYFLILSIQSAVFRRPGNENTRRPHSLYIDEFQTYSTPGFADMLTQGRSYRVSSVLATQARAQMAMGGGKDGKNFVELVSANARNIILFPGINKDDAKYYSEQFGEYEKTEIQVGTSHKKFNLLTGGLDRLGHPTETIRESKKMTANFTPTDLIYSQDPGNGFGQIAYSIIKNNSVQPARIGLITYIPRELNTTLDEMCEEYMSKYARESAAEYYEHSEEAEERQPSDTFTFPDDEDDFNDLADHNADPSPAPAQSESEEYIDWDNNLDANMFYDYREQPDDESTENGALNLSDFLIDESDNPDDFT